MSEPNPETIRVASAMAPGNIPSAISPISVSAPGFRNETARIVVESDARSQPAAGAPLAALDSIPRSYFWAIFGLATLIFLIQIWNYVVS